MKIAELRNLSKEDLSVKLVSLKEELGRLHYGKTIGQVDKPHRFKELRRTIAQIQTLLNETQADTKKE
jgi:large subunit ribosomal protein L29